MHVASTNPGLRSWCALPALVFVIALSTGGCVPLPKAPPPLVADTPELEAALERLPLQLVRIEGVDELVLGGTVEVFENREMGEGRTLTLNVIVVPSFSPEPEADALVFLEGGPGLAATNSVRSFTDGGEWQAIRAHRDVLLVDLRGTGRSSPLHLELGPDPDDLQSYFTDPYPVDRLDHERKRLLTKSDLTQYTTPICVDDLEDVRAALGYESLSLFGLSYGTRVALVYLRRYPESSRCAVLMGCAPTAMKMPLSFARDADAAIDRVFDACENDPDCRRAFPRVRAELPELLERLGREAAVVEIPHPATGEPTTLTITRDVFAEKIRSLLAFADGQRIAPLLIHRAFEGDFAPFVTIAVASEATTSDGKPLLAEGTYLSILGTEDVPLIDESEIAAATAGTFAGRYRIDRLRAAAGIWPRGELPERFGDAVVSDVPVLLLSGGMDPITPPRFAELVASTLSRSRHVVLPWMPHLPDGLSNLECLDAILADFVASADPEGIDISCVTDIRPPAFYTEMPDFGEPGS